MKESVAFVKEANKKKEFSPTRSDNNIQGLRNKHERQLVSLRGMIDTIRRDSETPSVESIAMQMSGMTTGERAPALLALHRRMVIGMFGGWWQSWRPTWLFSATFNVLILMTQSR